MSRQAPERGAGDAPRRAAVGSRLAFAALTPLVAVTIAATVTGSVALSGARAADPLPVPPPEGVAAAQPAPAPADPREVFRDPALRALAEPFLTAPGATCRPSTAVVVNVAEGVACDLGGGRIGLFTRLLTTEVLRDLRQGFVRGDNAEPGTVRSLRWRFADGQPGVRAGIPAEQDGLGEGVRVRFVDVEGVPRLYFDQDATACTGYLALVAPTGDDEADLEALRVFWADPGA